MMAFRRVITAAGMTIAACLVLTAPATAQWQIDSKDGKSSIKIGFLLQPQTEAVETADTTAWSKNAYLRRFRILFGGKVADKWTYFFETDSPNIGKAAANGTKDASTIFIQDAFVTYNHSDAFKVDTGMILLATSRQHVQSAASLLPVDYGAYSFIESTPFGERVGRDYGVQLRGYPFKQKLEYRVGIFQGLRGTDAKNTPRVTARAVYYPYGADPGFFYAGTFQGKKKMVGVGGHLDVQDSYKSYGVDAFVEQPINKGAQGVTAQFGWQHFDGKTFVTALPKQDTLFIEAAFHAGNGKYSPFVQYAARNYDNPASADQYTFQVGLACWLAGHNRNLKFSVGRQHTDRLPDRTQALAQLQIFYY